MLLLEGSGYGSDFGVSVTRTDNGQSNRHSPDFTHGHSDVRVPPDRWQARHGRPVECITVDVVDGPGGTHGNSNQCVKIMFCQGFVDSIVTAGGFQLCQLFLILSFLERHVLRLDKDALIKQ